MHIQNIKDFLKPSIFKLLIFSFIAMLFLYLAKEDVCGAGGFFVFCYNAYGSPFSYALSGDIDAALGHIKTLFLGNYFTKYGNFLLNPATLVLNILIMYSLVCIMSVPFSRKKN